MFQNYLVPIGFDIKKIIHGFDEFEKNQTSSQIFK